MNVAIIIPVFNEENALFEHFTIIDKCLKKDGVHANYMLIDDGSSDETWEIIKKIKFEFNNVNGIRLSRNFGKESAMVAGIQNINADYYVVMDSDLQHPPKYIKQMLDTLIEKDVNIVEGVKANRGKESLVYKIIAKTFYKLLYRIAKMDMDGSSDFKIFDNQVADAIRMFNERNLFFRGVVDYVGFNKIEYPFLVEKRMAGESSFSSLKLFKLALNAIISHTSRPLYLTIISGGIFFVLAIVLGIQTLFNYFMGNAVSGFSTVILLILITGSMIMLSIGIIGVYIAGIYDEVKARPQFILSDRLDKLKETEKANDKKVSKK